MTFGMTAAMTVGMIVRCILSLAVLLFTAYVVVANWCCVIITLRNKRRGIDRHHSTIPLFSIFLAGLSLCLFPWPSEAAARRAIWIMALPLLDVGNWTVVWGFLLLPVLLIRTIRGMADGKK